MVDNLQRDAKKIVAGVTTRHLYFLFYDDFLIGDCIMGTHVFGDFALLVHIRSFALLQKTIIMVSNHQRVTISA